LPTVYFLPRKVKYIVFNRFRFIIHATVIVVINAMSNPGVGVVVGMVDAMER
jgi:hypothetical protein